MSGWQFEEKKQNLMLGPAAAREMNFDSDHYGSRPASRSAKFLPILTPILHFPVFEYDQNTLLVFIGMGFTTITSRTFCGKRGTKLASTRIFSFSLSPLDNVAGTGPLLPQM